MYDKFAREKLNLHRYSSLLNERLVPSAHLKLAVASGGSLALAVVYFDLILISAERLFISRH